MLNDKYVHVIHMHISRLLHEFYELFILQDLSQNLLFFLKKEFLHKFPHICIIIQIMYKLQCKMPNTLVS
jgi:hypothetical protein